VTLRHQCGIGPLGARKLITDMGLGELLDFKYLRPDELFQVLMDDIAADHAAAEALLIADKCDNGELVSSVVAKSKQTEAQSNRASEPVIGLHRHNAPKDVANIGEADVANLFEDFEVLDYGGDKDDVDGPASPPRPPAKYGSATSSEVYEGAQRRERQRHHLRAETITGFNPEALRTMMRSCGPIDSKTVDRKSTIGGCGESRAIIRTDSESSDASSPFTSPGMAWALAQESPSTCVERATWLVVKNVSKRLCKFGIILGSAAPYHRSSAAIGFERLRLGSNTNNERFNAGKISWEAAEEAVHVNHRQAQEEDAPAPSMDKGDEVGSWLASSVESGGSGGPGRKKMTTGLKSVAESCKSSHPLPSSFVATYVNQTTHSNSSPSAQAPPTVSAMRTISDVGPASNVSSLVRQTSGLNVGGPSLADGAVAGGRGDEGNYLAKLLAGASAVGAAAALNSSEICSGNDKDQGATEQNAEDWERFEGRINALKSDGNALLKAAKYADANAKYTAAIDLCSGCFEFMAGGDNFHPTTAHSEAMLGSFDELKNPCRSANTAGHKKKPPSKLLHLLAICLSNRALTGLKMLQPEESLSDALRATHLSPSYAKASLRLAKAREALKQFRLASDAYAEAARLETDGKLRKAAIAAMRRCCRTAASNGF
jgi:tetratricopeptide (TPR) repeat protein